jgi:hypothetical protein
MRPPILKAGTTWFNAWHIIRVRQVSPTPEIGGEPVVVVTTLLGDEDRVCGSAAEGLMHRLDALASQSAAEDTDRPPANRPGALVGHPVGPDPAEDQTEGPADAATVAPPPDPQDSPADRPSIGQPQAKLHGLHHDQPHDLTVPPDVLRPEPKDASLPVR